MPPFPLIPSFKPTGAAEAVPLRDSAVAIARTDVVSLVRVFISGVWVDVRFECDGRVWEGRFGPCEQRTLPPRYVTGIMARGIHGKRTLCCCFVTLGGPLSTQKNDSFWTSLKQWPRMRAGLGHRDCLES